MKTFLVVLFCGIGSCALATHTFTVVNVRTAAVPFVAINTYPVGRTSFDLDSAPASLLTSLGTDFSVTVDVTKDYSVEIVGGTFNVSSVSETNLIAAWAAGFGAGLVWFGFGWTLRLTKRIPEF